MSFFRFPHTPHLAWLSKAPVRGDKVLSPPEARDLLRHSLLVEEKVDGANVGFSVGEDGTLRAQNRGVFLSRERSHPQFKPLFRWMADRQHQLSDALFPNLMLFGEWCFAVHSVRYTRLPDWFLAFDIYDLETGRFWSVTRRNHLIRSLKLQSVPQLGEGSFSLEKLTSMLGQSRLTDGPAEGLYVRQEEGDWLVARAKLVRPQFVQAIDEHWSRGGLEQNQVAADPSSTP